MANMQGVPLGGVCVFGRGASTLSAREPTVAATALSEKGNSAVRQSQGGRIIQKIEEIELMG